MEEVEYQDKRQSQRSDLLANRMVLITGASRGIGAATAKLLARHGATIGINYFKNEEAAEKVVASIKSEGGRALALKADVSNEQQVEDMIERFCDEFGTIDTLVLNASAVHDFIPKSFLQYRWEDFEEIIIGEIKGVFLPIKGVIPRMISKQRGCIVAISSITSRRASEGISAYGVGKSGVDALIKSLALELGPYGIRANIVAPGVTATDNAKVWSDTYKNEVIQRTPLHRIGTAEDVAGAVFLLCTNETSFISGTYLPVSGGSLML